jgi:cobalt-zinc-cadmium resistance protein CzcA
MLARLARFAVEKWALVLALTAVLLAVGYQCFRSIPIEAFPDVTDPQVDIVGVYPGQSAEEVEKRVTLELERVLGGTPNLRGLRSVSVFGLSLVTMTFNDKGSDFQNRTVVGERLREAEIPPSASIQMGPQATPAGQIYRFTLRGPKSLKELRAISEFVVERRLRAVQGVADVWSFGGFERQYQVRIDPVRLAAAGVSLRQVHEAVSKTNGNAGGGYVALGAQEFVVRGIGAVTRPEDIGLAVIEEVNGIPVRVRDVADIVEGSTPRRGSVGRGHEDEVVEGIVMLRRGDNPSEVLDALHERIRQLNSEVLPKDVHIDTFYDRTDLVDKTLSTVSRNMIEGVLIVSFVLYIFLRTFRGVLIVVAVVPVSLMTAFIGLKLMGLPANLISLGAIDFGILVDGAVIVVEATLHALEHRHQGETKASVIERAAALVARPVTFAMIVIIAALAPIFSLERTEGRIFAPMAYTYAFALMGALVSAALLVPALERILLKETAPQGDARWFVALRENYLRLFAWLGMRRFAVYVSAFVLLATSIVGARNIGHEFLPELNEGGLYITTTFPSTISLDETKEHTREIRERILKVPEAVDVLSQIGRPEAATQAEGSFNVEFFVPLADESKWRPGFDRAKLEAELRASLADIPGVDHNFSQPITDRVFETISGIIGQVVIKVHGEDLDKMTGVAEELKRRLGNVKGVTDLALYQAGDIPQLRAELDRDAIGRRGLSIADVEETIEVALGGAVATQVWDRERRFDVALKLPDAFRSNIEQLGLLPVGDPDRGVTLAEVAKITATRGRTSIWREDSSRFVAVKFNVRGRDLGGTVEEAKHAVEDLQMPESTYLTWSGEFENQRRAMGRLAIALPLALFAIFGILYANFRRLKPTLMILAVLPFATAGAVTGLQLMGERFSVSSAIGNIAVIGQIVLAGVVVCSRIDEAVREGVPDPTRAGLKTALRPVLATTSLALLGLVPAALSHAMGSETQRPFAIAIIAGLIAATPVVLILLPLAYGPRSSREATRLGA